MKSMHVDYQIERSNCVFSGCFLFTHQPSGMFRHSADEHHRRSNWGVKVFDSHGTVHRAVAGFLHVFGWFGRSSGRGAARV
jgi:hypothetical protein